MSSLWKNAPAIGSFSCSSSDSKVLRAFSFFPIAPADFVADDFHFGVILDDVVKALLASLSTAVSAQAADVNHLPFAADLLHQIADALLGHVDVVGRDFAPDSGFAHLVHVDQQRVHRDDWYAALLQLAHGSRQRVDLHRLEAAEIPILVDDRVDLVALLLRIELAVEPFDLDVEQIAPQLRRGLAERAPGALQSGVRERGSQSFATGLASRAGVGRSLLISVRTAGDSQAQADAGSRGESFEKVTSIGVGHENSAPKKRGRRGQHPDF